MRAHVFLNALNEMVGKLLSARVDEHVIIFSQRNSVHNLSYLFTKSLLI